MFNLIAPKKILYKEYEDIEEDPYDNSYKRQHQQLIQEILYKEDFIITNEELKTLKESQKIEEIYQGRNSFVKLNLNGEEKIFPLLVHISPSKFPAQLNRVSQYKEGELGIHCLNNGTNKGYLITYFPELKHEIRVFEISYNFEKGALSKIKNIVEIIKNKDVTFDIFRNYIEHEVKKFIFNKIKENFLNVVKISKDNNISLNNIVQCIFINNKINNIFIEWSSSSLKEFLYVPNKHYLLYFI